MENKLSIWELCMVFGIVAIILAGFMSAVSASPSEGEGDKNNCESIYIRSLNKDTTDISSVYIAKNILQIRDVKSNLTGAQKKLSTDLLQLLDSTFLPYGQDRETLEIQMKRLGQFRLASSVSPATDGRGADDMVYVYVYLKPHAETLTIEPYVWEVTDRDEENHLVVTWVEVNDLETLASREEVRTIRTVMPPLVRTGSVTTEGDAIHRTYDVRTTHSQRGSGVKVGIISDGVDYWTDARNSGDLPADVTVLSNTIGGDEGTAMLEIVHDMVPDADLYFHDRGDNTVAFNAAIDALVDAGCDVVCDDIGWLDEPFFEDGIIASHLTSVLASNDIVYVSAAGNDGEGHYQGDYSDSGYDTHDKFWYIDFDPGSSAIIVLQWNDEFGASGNDYDLYLYDDNTEGILLYSDGVQDGDDDPLEFISYDNSGDSVREAVIVVSNYNGAAATKTLELFINPSDGAYVYSDNINPTDSIFGHPAVPGAIAVGAIDASDPGNDDIENFSSQGPVTITYPSPISRPKPDLCGVDGVAVTGAGGFSTPFFGTSAAAPHIAAIAAQMWGAYPSKNGDEIRTVLCDSAVDLGSAGNDNIYGYGMTDALAAFDSESNNAPVADPNGPYTGTKDVLVTFDGSGSYDPDGSIDSYDWDFGDENSGSGVNPSHAYAQDGTYNVTLTVTDNDGATDSNSTTIILDSITTVTIDSVTSPTNLDYQTVTGTMESGAEVEVICPTATVGTVTVTDTTWSVEITDMTDGDNVITATATDSFEYTASDTATIVFDITPPSIISVTLNDTVVQTGAPIEVNVSATDENGIASVTADGIPLTLTEGYYVGTITAGPSPVTVNVTDEAGNLATDSISITIGIKGDFNSNGRVDIGDVAKVAFMVAGKETEDLNADFNENGRVDIGDAAKIAFYLAGKVSEL